MWNTAASITFLSYTDSITTYPLLSASSSRSWFLLSTSSTSPLLIRFFYSSFLLFCSILLHTNWLTTCLLFFCFYQNLAHATTMLNTQRLHFFPSKVQFPIMLTLVFLLKILCFPSPAVNQCITILVSILKKELSIIMIILARLFLHLSPWVPFSKLVQANDSRTVTSSKTGKKIITFCTPHISEIQWYLTNFCNSFTLRKGLVTMINVLLKYLYQNDSEWMAFARKKKTIQSTVEQSKLQEKKKTVMG